MADVFTAAKPRRTWSQRLLIAFNVVCILGALITAGVLGYSNDKLASVTRVAGLENVLSPDVDRPPGSPVNYLIVGADDDTGLDPSDPVSRGRKNLAGAFRTDTIMVLRIDPRDATARVLSIPRDLWVDIPGLKYPNRINAAVEGGGALRLIATVKQALGISIDHYVQVNFAGFKQLVTDIGGVPIYFDKPVRAKRSTPFLIPDAGCHTLDGNEALDFVRIRKDFQYFEDGRWRYDDSGDYGRISRQQFFIQVALKQAFAQGISNPNTLRKLVDTGVESIKIDDRLRTEDILDLGKRFRNFNPDNLVKYTIPAVDAVHGGAQVLEMVDSEAEPILDIFRGKADAASPEVPGGQAALSPGDVRIQVQNGGGERGQARSVTREFTVLGFDTVVPTDAPDRFDTTTVEYAAGAMAHARYAARYISGPVELRENDEISDTDVIVVIGADWTGTETSPKPESEVPVPSTTSTVPPSTTTTTTPEATTTTERVGVIPVTPPGATCG